MYVTHFTLPNFAFYSAFLGQFMHDPSMAGWEALLCLIIYAYYHRDDDVITYRANRDSLFIPRCIPRDRHADFKDVYGFHSYCDASWLLRSSGCVPTVQVPQVPLGCPPVSPAL